MSDQSTQNATARTQRSEGRAARRHRDEVPAEVSSAAFPTNGVDFDDEQTREKQRKRNADLVNTPPFSGDTDDLLEGGVPRQLVEGNDPDAKLID
jgi:hypothetical protein